MRRCEQCGADISKRGSRAKWCVPCSIKYSKSHKRKNTGAAFDTRPTLCETKNLDPQCQNCIYYSTHYALCDYFNLTGHTRTSLHKGENVDINKPCQERVLAKAGGKRGMV